MTNAKRIPLIVAHRGDMQHAPENTLAAFESAINKGADIIELDIHLTSDEEIVIHHDYYLERMTNGKGFIGHQSLSSLKKLDAGSWFDSKFTGERIPTLHDVLELGKDKVRFEIELKTPSVGFLEKVIGELEQMEVVDKVDLTTPHIPLLFHIKRNHPKLTTGLFFYELPDWMDEDLGIEHIMGWMELADAQVAHIPPSLINRKNVKAMQDTGFRVHGFFNEHRDRLDEGFQYNLDQLSTNFLDRALEIKSKLANSK